MNLKPGAFTSFPWESLLHKTEAEVIASNIMKIRKRLGDKWPLKWDEYKAKRLKDTGFSQMEKDYFEQVMPLIPDAIGAIAFSQSWAKDARKAAEARKRVEKEVLK